MKRKASSQQNLIIIAAVIILLIIGGIWYFSKPTEEPEPQENKSPIVVASGSETFTSVEETITFTAEGSKDPDGEIVEYKWNMGDGSTAEGEQVTHSYEKPGYYVCLLEAKDDDGATTTNDVSPIFIKVERPSFVPTLDSYPIAIIGVQSQIVEQEQEVLFDGSSSHGWEEYRGDIQGTTEKITGWTWDFGDGTTGDGEEVLHTFIESGNYYVELIVEDESGKTDTIGRTIRVLPPGVEYEEEIKNPDTFIYARDHNIPISLDPFDMGDQGRPLVLAISDRLTFTGQGDIEPKVDGSLSESWEVSEDGLYYTFYLREGVKFWNGDELTAEDVEYSYERGMALAVASGDWSILYERLMGVRPGNPVPEQAIKESVEVVDEYTVRFNLNEIYAAFLLDMAYPRWGIVQKEYAIENGAWSWDRSQEIYEDTAGIDQPMWDGDALMSTGPFKVKEKSTGVSIVLERFDDYWQGPAKIKYYRDIYVPEWSTRRLMLLAGDVDAINVHSPSEFEQIVGTPGLEPYIYKYGGFVEVIYFGINFDPEIQPPENQVPPDFFDDPHMRKAFAYAFPYDKYIEEIWLGYAERAKGVLPPGWPGAFEHFPYEHNLEKAEEELKLAHDGKYYEEGFQVCAGCQLWATGTMGRAYEMWAEEFAKIDPKFKIVYVGDKWSDMLQRPIGALVAVIGLDPAWYRNVYHSTYGFERSYGWKDERVDYLIEESTKTPFMDERVPMLREAMDIVEEECPAILTVYNPHLVALREYIDGYYFQINTLCDQGHVYYISKG